MRNHVSILMLTCILALTAGSGMLFAQQRGTKTVSTTKLEDASETFEYTEALSLETAHEMLVTPLIATVKVLAKGSDGKTFVRAHFTGSKRDTPTGLSGKEYLAGKIVNGKNISLDLTLLKAQAIYDFCQETNADLIVVPQFNIRHKTTVERIPDDNGNMVEVIKPVELDGKYVMIVDVVGYPAVYSNFREGTSSDGWIKDLYRKGQFNNTDEEVNVVETISKVLK